MARPVYSQQFLAWSADSDPAPYTVPDGFVAVVRDISVWSGGGAMTNWQIQIVEGAKFDACQFTIESIAQVHHQELRVVLNAGQILLANSDEPTDGVVSGYLLVNP